MVDRHGAIDYFIEPVAIHVALTKLWHPCSIYASERFSVFSCTAGVGVKIPPFREFAVPPIQRPETRARIITPAGDHAGPFPVKICDRSQKAVHAVAVGIVPFRISWAAVGLRFP